MKHSSPEIILLLTILSGFIAILYGYLTSKQILSAKTGNRKMSDSCLLQKKLNEKFSLLTA